MPNAARTVQVFKRPGARSPYWYLRYWEVDGPTGQPRERWKSTGTTVRKHAEQQRRELERRLERQAVGGLDALPERPQARDWTPFEDAFLEFQRATKPPATVELYQIALRHFRQAAGARRLDEITAATVEDFAVARLRQGVAAATVNRDLRHLRAALNWAARRGQIPRSPNFTGAFLRTPRKRPPVMPESDFLAIVAVAESPTAPVTRRSGAWWRTLMYLGYYLGLRRGELLALAWRDIDRETRELRVQAASSKSRQERVLPLAEPIAQLLIDWRRRSNAAQQDAVLPWPYGTLNPLYDDWRKLQAAAGIAGAERYTLKSLRSSCASLMIAASVPTLVVKDFLGHAKVTTTETYYVNTAPAMRAAAKVRPVRINAAPK